MIRIYSWNPRRSLVSGRFSRFTKIGPRVSNFGDLIGPTIVEAMLRRDPDQRFHMGERSATLFSVGSVLHEAQSMDVVWGAGRNGKKSGAQHRFTDLDVRAVRGPLTGDFLRSRGVDVPDVYGDPALLIPHLFPEVAEWTSTKVRKVAVIPNFNERAMYRDHEGYISPIGSVFDVVRQIAESEAVVASSLHGIIVAEALGVPAIAFRSGVEPRFKYDDYYAGTGRPRGSYSIPDDLDQATHLVQQGTDVMPWDPGPLIAAFPYDLWHTATS